MLSIYKLQNWFVTESKLLNANSIFGFTFDFTDLFLQLKKEMPNSEVFLKLLRQCNDLAELRACRQLIIREMDSVRIFYLFRFLFLFLLVVVVVVIE